MRNGAGDQLHLKVLRDGNQTELSYEVLARRPLVPVLHGVDCVPSYFIVGGLVFVPLSIPFLEHAYGGAPCSLPLGRALVCQPMNADQYMQGLQAQILGLIYHNQYIP